jgi:hypothetical protein
VSTTPRDILDAQSIDTFVSKTYRVLGEYRFHTNNVDEVLAIIRDAGVSGTLTLDISQGGVGSIRFHEEQKITPTENNA